MAIEGECRTQLEGKLFVEVRPGGGLIFSSGYIGATRDDEKLQTELIVGPGGVKKLAALLAPPARTPDTAETGIQKACNRNYHDLISIFQGAKYCPECGERLSS